MKKSGKWQINAAVAILLASMGSAQATILSGYGFDINYDETQLDSSWTTNLIFDQGLNVATLSFENASNTTTDYFLKNFTFSITPIATTQTINTFSHTENIYNSNDQGDLILVGTRTQSATNYSSFIGGAISSITSFGTNTLPSITSTPSAYGENNFTAKVSSSTGTIEKVNSIYYLDAQAGNQNTLIINEGSNLPNLTTVRIDQPFVAGTRFQFAGKVYIALQDRHEGNLFDQEWDPSLANNPGSYWLAEPLPPTKGGELDQPMEVTLTSEIWTPTFLQPGTRHCGGLSCMVAENGQYRPTAFKVKLNVTANNYTEFTDITTPVPEPETYGMMLAGIGIIGFMARRRNKKSV